MQRRGLHWLFGTLAVLLSVLLVIRFFEWMQNNSFEANFNKIQPGMTKEQVETLLGDGCVVEYWNGGFHEEWIWLHDGFSVSLGEDGTVTNKSVEPKSRLEVLIKRSLRKIGL